MMTGINYYVSTDLNTSYKIFEFIMDGKTIKNIFYQELTSEEYNYLKQSNNSEY